MCVWKLTDFAGRKLATVELHLFIVLVVWTFELQSLPASLASFAAHDVMVPEPLDVYLRLAEAKM